MQQDSKMRPRHEIRRAARGAFTSLYHTYVSPPPRDPGKFLHKAILAWLRQYLRVMFTSRHRFPHYDAPAAQQPGVFAMPEQCRVALVGDWGSGTASAYRVMQHIRQGQQPDITIHLGDIYYSGTVDEVNRYFLGDEDWYRGPLGTYALNANHEMYSGGTGYFEHVLPAFQQPASYFCLANAYWRIVAVDTGYYAKFLPLLELLLASKLLKLHQENRRWLAEVVFQDTADRRPVVLLSHHQWYSAFEDEYTRLGRQLQPYLDRVVLWYWGHEHRFAAYGPYGFTNAPRVPGRCIGHGGMPIELGDTPKRERNLVCYDRRANPANVIDGQAIGYCGNALLHFEGPTLTARYDDENGTTLLSERWRVDPATGRTSGEVVQHSSQLAVVAGKTITQMVQ